jgi:short-subunit dehydrogenase
VEQHAIARCRIDAFMEGRIVITGASRGIGRATALELAKLGANLVLVARDEAKLHEVAREVRASGGMARIVGMDLTRDASVIQGAAAVLEHGPVDVLINNAGTCHQGTFLDLSESQRAEEWQLNYFGVLRLTRQLLPGMVARRQGRIINVSSLLGQSAAPTTANYSATKAALEAFSQGLRGELAGFGIKVEVFVAPHTQTALGQRVTMDGVVSVPVEYVARRLARAVGCPTDRSYGSPVYRVLSWIVRGFPRFMELQMNKAARSALRVRNVPVDRP